MAFGISGDSNNPVTLPGGTGTENAMLIELRLLNRLIQQGNGTIAMDDLHLMRADEAFDLSIPTPPGT